MEKLERLNKLKIICESCRRCSLGETRKKLVFGEGNVDSRIMSIAEAPGKDEDKTGRPFMGKSGQLYRKMLQAIDLNPEQDVYMVNVLKCRPPNNRKPERDEISICSLYLKKQIEIISPKMLLFLGKTAVEGLCPNLAKDNMEHLRNLSKNIGMLMYQNIPIIITYHPAALIYTKERKTGAIEDFKFIQNSLLILEK